MRVRAVVLVGLFTSATAFADKLVVVGRVDDDVWSDGPTEAGLDQKVELSFVVIGAKVRAPDGVEQVVLGGRKVKVTANVETKTIHWATVEPVRSRAPTTASSTDSIS